MAREGVIGAGGAIGVISGCPRPARLGGDSGTAIVAEPSRTSAPLTALPSQERLHQGAVCAAPRSEEHMQMTTPEPSDLLRQVWEYPLFEALWASPTPPWVSRWRRAHSNTNLNEHHCPSVTWKRLCSLRQGWVFPGLRSGTRAGRSHTVPAMAAPFPVRRAAAVRHCSSPTIKASMSLTLPPRRPANLERSRLLMSETKSFRCTGKTARRCNRAGSTFLAVSRRSRGAICGFRTGRDRRCSCPSAASASADRLDWPIRR